MLSPCESEHVFESDGRMMREPRSKLLRSQLCGSQRAGQLTRQANTLRLPSPNLTLPRCAKALLQVELPLAQGGCVDGEGSALVGNAVVCG